MIDYNPSAAPKSFKNHSTHRGVEAEDVKTTGGFKDTDGG